MSPRMSVIAPNKLGQSLSVTPRIFVSQAKKQADEDIEENSIVNEENES